MFFLLATAMAQMQAATKTVTYTVASTKSVTTSGTAPDGSSAAFFNSYSTKDQLTAGNNMDLTLSGYKGCTIKGITLSMKSNSKAGAGYFYMKIGTAVTLSAIGSVSSSVTFNDASWNGAYTTTYTNVTPTMSNDSYEIKSGEQVKISIGATTNSLYCQSFTITYEDASTPAKTLSSIAVSGTPIKTTYTEGEKFDPAGLTVTGTYSDGNSASITEDITWTFDPATLVAGTTSVSVTAKVGDVTSSAYTVNGLTVNGKQAKAGTYTIGLNNAFYGISAGNNGTEQSKETINCITVVSGCASSASSKTYYDANHIRYYVGSYLKLSVPDGFKITKVVFTADGTWDDAGVSANSGDYSNKTWTGNAQEVDFDFTKQCRASSIEVTYADASTPPTPEKELIGIEVSGTPAEFWKGDVFNHNGMTVTATWDDGDETDVTSLAEFSTPDMTTAGEKTVTVTYQGETATYTINVQTIANTEAYAYTVAEAKALIDAGKDLETEVYVKGTVSQVDSYNSTYGSITYWIDNNEFEVYGGLNFGGEKFAAQTDITVGDDVVIKGIIKKYNTTYEFDKNNVLVKHDKVATLSIADITVANGEDINPVVNTNVTGEYLIEYVSNNEEVVLADDNELVTMGVGEATITATLVADGYKAAETTFKVTVTSNVSVTSVTLGGTPKLEYTYGETFDRTGITATANYSDDSQVDVTSSATWTVTPSTALTESGEVTVTAAFGGKSASQTYNVTVNKKEASIEIADITVQATKTATISATTTPADAELTYTITEGADKISIADGVITGVAEGTATVKAAFAGTAEYAAAEKTFTVTVTAAPAPGTGDFTLVTSASDLVAGREYLVVGAKTDGTTYVMGTISGTNTYATAVTATVDNNTIASTDEMAIVTLGGKEGAWTLQTNQGYLNNSNNAKNTLKASETSSSTATIELGSDGKFTITFDNTGYNTLQFNAANPRFACYTGTQQNVNLYYREASAPVVRTLDHIEVVEGYKAEYTDGDAFEKATVMAYYQEEGVEPVNVTEKATFSGYDLSAETSGEQTVNVSYTEGEVTATTSYTINFTAVTKRTVTIVEPVNGTLKVVVKATGTEIATGARVADGTVLKITNTPDEGYVLRKIVVTDTEKHNYTAQNKEITVNGSDVTINAIFIKGDNYTYTWSVNGQVASQDVYKAGATVTAPAVTAAGPDGKTFVGWSRTATVDADNCTLATVDPTAVTDRTYFAVFATATQGTGGTDGSNVYYEKVDLGDTSWLNEKFLLVYEQASNAALIFDGQPSGATNVIGANITEQNGKKVITDKSSGQELEVEYYGAYNTNMRMKLVGSNPVKYLATTGSGQSKFQIEEKGNLGTEAYAGFTVDNTDNGRWNIKVYDRYLNYSGSDFRLGNIGANREIQIYAKKGGTVTTYSEYTTGMTVDPHDFQLVTGDDDLVAGREYIIVSKFINDDDSRTIYGLSVDNADSRTENGQDGESKTTTNYRRGETGVTFGHGDYFASIDNKISILTLGGAEGAWTFNSAAGYLVKGGGESDRFLRINNASAPATIAKDDKDVATIIYKVVKDGELKDGDREVFLNINGGYPRYGAYAHANLTDADKKFNFAASYLYYRDPIHEISLGELEANGITGDTEYTLTDELEVVYTNGNSVWVKDSEKSYAYRANEEMYNATWYGSNFLSTDASKQNNWIELGFTGENVPSFTIGTKLTGVKGTYTGNKDRSHKLVVSDYSIDKKGDLSDDENKARLNKYCPANFWNDNIYDYVTAGGHNFFLMNPKIEEVCIVTAAVWDNGNFVVPAKQIDEETGQGHNGYDLNGAIAVNWNLVGGQPGEIPAGAYEFPAIVTKVAGSTRSNIVGKPGMNPASQGDYFVVYPINFVTDGSIITGVDDLNARTVKAVRYYDVAGHMFNEAQPGLNIIVTEYSDGTHSAVKVIR